MKKLKQRYRCMEDRKYGNGKTTGCPTKTFGHDRRCGFTLVELVIVIAIVIILSVISVPIYRGYVDKSKFSEAYALLGSILSAQKAYFSEHGNFLMRGNSSGASTCYDAVLGIDARGNKYFTFFHVGYDAIPQRYFDAGAFYPPEFGGDGNIRLLLQYNLTKGSRYCIHPGAIDDNWKK